MFNGKIHQLAAPQEIYNCPHTWMVAEFIGLTNFIEGNIVGREGWLFVIDTAIGTLRCEGAATVTDAKPERLIAVRPEAIQLSQRSGGGPRSSDPTMNRLQGVVRARAFLGNLVDYRVEVASGVVLRVQGDPRAPLAVGDAVEAAFQPRSTWSVPAREERVR